MQPKRPYVLSIAGYDPSGGAGLLSDIKTFEAHKVYGLGVCSAITFQNDVDFVSVKWLPVEDIQKQIELQLERFKIEVVKIGLVENLEVLAKLLDFLNSKIEKVRVVWDPIMKASAGFNFHNSPNTSTLEGILSKCSIITPNWEEIRKLLPEKSELEAAQLLSQHCDIYLKGGHNSNDVGRDYLYTKNKSFSFKAKKKLEYPKHGSGCVFSASLTAHFAKGYPLNKACIRAKSYTAHFLDSSQTLLGYHNI